MTKTKQAPPASRWRGVHKEFYRRLVARPNHTYKAVLTLPGTGCYDLKELHQQGAINAKTHVVAVERDVAGAATIRREYDRSLKSKIPLFHLHRGELVEFSSEMAFDLINVDLCDCLDLPVLQWLGRIRLQHGADICLTIANPRRNRADMEFYERLAETFFTPGKGKIFARDMRAVYPHIGRLTEPHGCNVLAILAALHQYDLEAIPPEKPGGDSYSDHIARMNFYRFRNLQPAKVPRPSLESLLKDDPIVLGEPLRRSASTHPLNTKSLALILLQAEKGTPGQKSYATLRKKQHLAAAKARGIDPSDSERALKAWVTRHRNALGDDPLIG